MFARDYSYTHEEVMFLPLGFVLSILQVTKERDEYLERFNDAYSKLLESNRPKTK